MTRSMGIGATLVGLLSGCGSRVATTGDGTDGTEDATSPTDPSSPTDASMTADGTGGDGGGGIGIAINRDVDILFVVDNSGTMGSAQGRLARGLDAMVAELDAETNYRIGITTTDNGNPWCGATSPEAGNLQLSSCLGRTGQFVFNGNPPADATAIACTDVCTLGDVATTPTTTDYDTTPRSRPWLESSNGVTNLDAGASMLDALRCTLPQGIAGCGFEAPLESMYKALLRFENADESSYGFMRAGAVLAIVILTDEVDCSNNSEYQSIFLPADMGGNPDVFWSDPTASAPSSAVCWNAGATCTGGPGTYDECHATNKDVDGNEGVSDGDAVLHPLARYADYLQQIEDQKQAIAPGQQVLVTLIDGVPQGYESGADIVYADAFDAQEQVDFGIGAGCEYDPGNGEPVLRARPPVREREVAEQFQVGAARNLYSICDDDFTNTLQALAAEIRDQMPRGCMPACVADSDVVTAGLDPVCELRQEGVDLGSGSVMEVAVPPCEGGNAVPADADVCFVALVGDAMSAECSEAGWNLEFEIVRRPGVPAPPGVSVTATCDLSENKAIDCPLLP